MNCLNHILNGTTNSKIFGAARKRGLVYGMGSSVASNAHNSYWDFDGEVNIENAEELFDLIKIELMKTLNGEIIDMDSLGFEMNEEFFGPELLKKARTVAVNDYANSISLISINKINDCVNKVVLLGPFAHGVNQYVKTLSIFKTLLVANTDSTNRHYCAGLHNLTFAGANG